MNWYQEYKKNKCSNELMGLIENIFSNLTLREKIHFFMSSFFHIIGLSIKNFFYSLKYKK